MSGSSVWITATLWCGALTTGALATGGRRLPDRLELRTSGCREDERQYRGNRCRRSRGRRPRGRHRQSPPRPAPNAGIGTRPTERDDSWRVQLDGRFERVVQRLVTRQDRPGQRAATFASADVSGEFGGAAAIEFVPFGPQQGLHRSAACRLDAFGNLVRHRSSLTPAAIRRRRSAARALNRLTRTVAGRMPSNSAAWAAVMPCSSTRSKTSR